MQKFSVEVNAPIEIKLTDNDRFEPESAIIEIVPTKRGSGFVIFIKDMTDHVSFQREDDCREFNFDKKAFDERMQKLKDR